MAIKYIFSFALLSLFVGQPTADPMASVATSKVDGVCFVGPPRRPAQNPLHPIEAIGAGWVAITPYAFSRAGEPSVTANHDRQWWGERTDGAKETIAWAREAGLKVMLKPHVWVRGQGWCGDFTLETDAEWQKWEEDYLNYVRPLAELAEETGVEVFCIGTEYRQVVRKRPVCFSRIICALREVYSGKLTYAANWDNYEQVSFWAELDYIGIDAYFPLTEAERPTVRELEKAWKPWKTELATYAAHHQKPLLFTEYGYRPVQHTAARPWETKGGTLDMEMQQRAYEALYQSFWQEDWFAGGFLWKWFADPAAGGANHQGFTPQNKPVLKVISSWYSKS